MFRRYNLVQVIRFLARLAPLFTDPKVRAALRWSKEALIKHKGVVTRLRTVNSLGTLELNPDLLRFGFLTLVKSSQATFPPKTQSKVFKVDNLTLLQTRYDSEAMKAIFGSSFLPVISSTDSMLIKRLFEASHVLFSLEHEDRINQNHLSLNQTIGRTPSAQLLSENLAGCQKTTQFHEEECKSIHI